jgi:hypothetical protein
MPTAEQARKDVLDILTALEFGTRKEEKELLDGVFAALGVQRRRRKEPVAAAIVEGPGFEPFLLEVLTTVRPFALMLRDLYTFLNRAEATTRRRASIFRVSAANAAAKLDFSLDHFPRELLSALTEGVRKTAVVELRFPELEPSRKAGLDNPIEWGRLAADAAWRSISPCWDQDFFDFDDRNLPDFHRTLSYARAVLHEEDEAAWSRLCEVAEPLLDRLAAIVACANSIRPLELRETYLGWQKEAFHFQPTLPEPRFHRVRCEEARPALELPTKPQYTNETQRTVLDELQWHLYSMAVAVHFFRNERVRKDDPTGWRGHEQSWFPGSEGYLARVEDLAASYRQRLDRVAPVVEELTETVLEDRLIEFLLLPFWKHRWFLYELWTLVLALDGAGRHWRLELEGLEETAPGVIEWRLPGGTATRPVAAIGDGEHRALCWTQRKTYHPGTGEGLEPDLRFTTASPSYHDLVIVESKDRRKPPGPEMEEITRRYVEGTCTESLWLVNYDRFTEGLDRLERIWPDRKVHVVSEFRPGQVPQEFGQELETILTRHLGRPAGTRAEPALQDIDEIEVTLTWGAQPRDLDLHLWIMREDGTWQVSFRDPGRLDAAPFAQLDEDVQRGNGRETVKVLTRGLSALKIAVHNYSDESSLSASDAEVVVRLGERRRATFSVPVDGYGRWWTVAEYGHATAQLRIVDVLGETEPADGPAQS